MGMAKEKEKKSKKAKKSKRGDGEARSEARQRMMGMHAAVPQQMAMMMQMRAMATRGHMMMRPLMMASPAMMGHAAAFPPGYPMGRGARRSRPIRGGAFGRPARPEPLALCNASNPSSSSGSSSSSSSSPRIRAAAPPGGRFMPAAAEQTVPGSIPLSFGPDLANRRMDAAVPASNKISQASDLAAIDVPVPMPTPSFLPKTPPDWIQEPPGGTAQVHPHHEQTLTSGAALGAAPVAPTAATAALAVAAAGAASEEQPEEEQLQRPRAPPKPGKISFNIQGAKDAMAAAKAQVEVEEAVAAVRARRLNSRDASTQTVRDPERQDGDIVTIWRLRPRGMESFPHFPRQARKKARQPVLCAAAVDDTDSFPTAGTKSRRKKPRHDEVERISESVERNDVSSNAQATAPIDVDGFTEALLPEGGAAHCADGFSSNDAGTNVDLAVGAPDTCLEGDRGTGSVDSDTNDLQGGGAEPGETPPSEPEQSGGGGGGTPQGRGTS